MRVNSFLKDIQKVPELPDISNLQFHPIIDLPSKVFVQDFTKGNNLQHIDNTYTIGRYNEKRPNMYKGELFEKDGRYIHMGIDIGAPVGTKVSSFWDGDVLSFRYNSYEFDYGYTIIIEHTFNNQSIYALYGHLSESSIQNKKIGQKISSGETIAHVGNESENGGWPPHIHFQLSLIKPKKCDLPGVVSQEDHEIALRAFPDPRLVLGPLY